MFILNTNENCDEEDGVKSNVFIPAITVAVLVVLASVLRRGNVISARHPDYTQLPLYADLYVIVVCMPSRYIRESISHRVMDLWNCVTTNICLHVKVRFMISDCELWDK